MSNKEIIISKISDVGGKISVKSALNPILWLCGITITPILVAISVIKKPIWLMVILLILIVLIVVIALFSFLYLLFKDPDKLQSEEYQLRKQEMELIQRKGEEDSRVIDKNIIITVNSSKK